MKDIINRIRTLWYIKIYQDILRKVTFGPNTAIRCKLDIRGPGKVVVGSDCIFEPNPWGSEYVTIYTHRKEARIVIGNNVVIRATRFGSHLSVTVEDGSVLEYSSIYDSDFHNLDATRRDEDFNKGDRAVKIGEGSYVGCESLCSKGTVLGKNVTMLPGTVIGTKTIPDNCLVFGNPAKIIKK